MFMQQWKNLMTFQVDSAVCPPTQLKTCSLLTIIVRFPKFLNFVAENVTKIHH